MWIAMAESLTIRLILTLVAHQRFDEAIAAFDRGRERYELAGLTRAELATKLKISESALYKKLRFYGIGKP